MMNWVLFVLFVLIIQGLCIITVFIIIYLVINLGENIGRKKKKILSGVKVSKKKNLSVKGLDSKIEGSLYRTERSLEKLEPLNTNVDSLKSQLTQVEIKLRLLSDSFETSVLNLKNNFIELDNQQKALSKQLEAARFQIMEQLS